MFLIEKSEEAAAFPDPPRSDIIVLKGAFAQDSTLPRSVHLWLTPAERRGPAALRQSLLGQLLTQARLRQPSACP